MLTVNELNKLNTKRLLGVLNSARTVRNHNRRSLMMPHVCCEMCMEWMLSPEEFDEMVEKPTAHLTTYISRIKNVLSTREHVK